MTVLSFARLLSFVVVTAVAVPALADAHGVLRVVKGDVQIKTPDGQTTKARLGAEVHPKDTIITGKDARAKIVMMDDNEINVSPESNVEIQNYESKPEENKKDVLLNVLYGKVRAKVEQKYDGKTSKFQVKTPSAVAGVRGTDFMTSYSPQTQSSQVVTFKGAVEFGIPGPGGSIANAVSVTPGRMASNTGHGAPSAPTSIPKDQLAKMDHESKADTGANGGSDSRTPAQDGKKKGDGDKGDKSGDSGKSSGDSASGGGSKGGDKSAASGSSGGSSTSGGSTGSTVGATSTDAGASSGTAGGSDGGRAPASVDSGSSGGGSGGPTGPTVKQPNMAPQPIDMPTGGGPGPNGPIPLPPPPPNIVVVTPPPPPPPPTNTCTACIANTTGKPTITVHIKP